MQSRGVKKKRMKLQVCLHQSHFSHNKWAGSCTQSLPTSATLATNFLWILDSGSPTKTGGNRLKKQILGG